MAQDSLVRSVAYMIALKTSSLSIFLLSKELTVISLNAVVLKEFVWFCTVGLWWMVFAKASFCLRHSWHKFLSPVLCLWWEYISFILSGVFASSIATLLLSGTCHVCENGRWSQRSKYCISLPKTKIMSESFSFSISNQCNIEGGYIASC